MAITPESVGGTSELIRSLSWVPTPDGLTEPELAELLDALDQARVYSATIVARASRKEPVGDDPQLEAETLLSARRRLASIHEAYQRLSDGTYNRCTSCGGSIGAARLSVLPESDRCVACAAAPPFGLRGGHAGD